MAAKVRRDDKGIYWVVVHYEGRRTKKRVGRDRRLAEEVAKKLQAKLVLGELKSDAPKEATVPFGPFAEQWLRREVELPIERGIKNHLAPGTARVYRLQVSAHLLPYFGDADLSSIGLAEVQGFYDRCIDTGRPRSAKSIDIALHVLRMVLTHARRQGLLETNAVERWKADRPRRRSSAAAGVPVSKVLSAEELQRLLDAAESDFPRRYPLVLFLADTGARFGEAAAIRWSDLDLELGTARISRSFSSGVQLGPTKTGRNRVVELSQRLCRVLADAQPNVFPIPEETLVFPNQLGGFLQGTNFRTRVFSKLVREVLGAGRHYSPHCLRHTWASLHMARGTPIKWIQEQGGWTTAKLLLDTYGHFMPTEMRGFADALTTAPNGPQTAPTPETRKSQPETEVFSAASEAIGPRSPITRSGSRPKNCKSRVRNTPVRPTRCGIPRVAEWSALASGQLRPLRQALVNTVVFRILASPFTILGPHSTRFPAAIS